MLALVVAGAAIRIVQSGVLNSEESLSMSVDEGIFGRLVKITDSKCTTDAGSTDAVVAVENHSDRLLGFEMYVDYYRGDTKVDEDFSWTSNGGVQLAPGRKGEIESSTFEEGITRCVAELAEAP